MGQHVVKKFIKQEVIKLNTFHATRVYVRTINNIYYLPFTVNSKLPPSQGCVTLDDLLQHRFLLLSVVSP